MGRVEIPTCSSVSWGLPLSLSWEWLSPPALFTSSFAGIKIGLDLHTSVQKCRNWQKSHHLVYSGCSLVAYLFICLCMGTHVKVRGQLAGVLHFPHVDLRDWHQASLLLSHLEAFVSVSLSLSGYLFWGKAPLRISSTPSSYWDPLREFSEAISIALSHSQTPVFIHWPLFKQSEHLTSLWEESREDLIISKGGKWSVRLISVSKL